MNGYLRAFQLIRFSDVLSISWICSVYRGFSKKKFWTAQPLPFPSLLCLFTSFLFCSPFPFHVRFPPLNRARESVGERCKLAQQGPWQSKQFNYILAPQALKGRLCSDNIFGSFVWSCYCFHIFQLHICAFTVAQIHLELHFLCRTAH